MTISGTCVVPTDKETLWDLLVSDRFLEKTHPWAKSLVPNRWEDSGHTDTLQYLNGKVFLRKVTVWEPCNKLVVQLLPQFATRQTNQILCLYTIRELESGCSLEIGVAIDNYRHHPRPTWPIKAQLQLVPGYKKYVKHLLFGILHYVNSGTKVSANQFGSHRWFS